MLRRCAVTALGAILALLLKATAAIADDALPTGMWAALEPGLELAVFPAVEAPPVTDAIHVLRIDPRRFQLRLLNASAPGHDGALTPRDWCARNGLVAVINASMYQRDYRTSVSLMKTNGHTNNPRLTKDKAVLAFNPRDDGVPAVQIIDRQYQNFDALSLRYDTFVQSIRMVSLAGANVWQPQAQKWSTAAIAIDRRGQVLFIHASVPYATHDLINVLLALPLDLRNAMYVEGGPEAQLYVRSGRREVELVGRYDTGILGASAHPGAWPLPNVIGVMRITPEAAQEASNPE
jgi:hypothetical protein